MSLMNFNWIAGENAFDYEGLCRLEPENADLKDVFPDDDILKDEDHAYDNYLHIHYSYEGGRLAIAASYENDCCAEEIILDLTSEEEAYFKKIVSEAISKSEEKFCIIPNNFVSVEIETSNPDDAMIDFVTGMDMDMNAHFRAVPRKNLSSEIAKYIISLIRDNQLSDDDCDNIFCALKNNQNCVLGGKLWTEEDIRIQLKEKDIDPTRHNISKVNDNIGLRTDIFDRKMSGEDSVIKNAVEEAIENHQFTRYATDIDWDTDYEEDKEYLPEYVKIPDDVENDSIDDYLSDEYEFCVNGFVISYKNPENAD